MQAEILCAQALFDLCRQAAETAARSAVTLEAKSLEADARLRLASAVSFLGEKDTALEELAQAQKLYEDLDDDGGLLKALTIRSTLIVGQEELQTIFDFMNELREEYVDKGNPVRLYEILNNLATLNFRTGQIAQAEELSVQSLELLVAAHDYRRAAQAAITLGGIAFARGNLAQAQDYNREGLEYALRVDDRLGSSSAYANLGEISHERGCLDQAGRQFADSLLQAELGGDQEGIAWAHWSQGKLALDQRQLNRTHPQLGPQYLNQADTLLTKAVTELAGSPYYAARAELDLARLRHIQGLQVSAWQRAEQAAARLGPQGEQDADVLVLKAEIRLAEGRPADAWTLARSLDWTSPPPDMRSAARRLAFKARLAKPEHRRARPPEDPSSESTFELPATSAVLDEAQGLIRQLESMDFQMAAWELRLAVAELEPTSAPIPTPSSRALCETQNPPPS